MKIIINTTNIVIGGALQVSLSFLDEIKKHLNHEYHVFLSPNLRRQLNVFDFPDNFHFYFFEHSPSKLRQWFKVKKRLRSLEKEINPDLVFTVFGPAYWTPKSLHVSGFADGWCYTPNSIAFNNLSIKRKLKLKLLIPVKNFLIKKSDYLIVETETAKENIVKFLGFQHDKIFVVGNACHSVFLNKPEVINNEDSNIYKMLVLSSFYPHKNLAIINDVVKKLRAKTKASFKFFLTIPDNIFDQIFFDSEYIENLGPQNIIDCPQLYQEVDAVFLPTLLETFTANYPEAMMMKKPILTSDLDFARELCGNAALYFNPLSADDIATKIIQLKEDEALQSQLKELGSTRIQEFETAESRAIKYLEIFNSLIRTNQHL